MKNLICIRCPRGCALEIDEPLSSPLVIRGNACRLGLDFARDELSDPRRTLCTTVAVRNGECGLVSVWTPQAIPQDQILPLAIFLRTLIVDAPIALDQVILANALGTGIPVIASMAVALKGQ